MIIVWILLGVVAFFTLLLSFSLTFYAEISDHAELSVGIFGLRFRILPAKEPEEETPKQKARREAKEQKKADRKKKKAKGKQAEQKIRELSEKKPDEKSIGEILELILAILQETLPHAGRMLSHLRISVLRLHVTVACDEADQTAIRCGAVGAGTYTLLGALDSLIKLKVKSVHVHPDFITGESCYDICFKVKLRLVHIAGEALAALGGIFIRLVRKSKSVVPPANVRSGAEGGEDRVTTAGGTPEKRGNGK